MKYSDEQRIEKILNYAVKLQNFIKENDITTDKILTEEKTQWVLTTPLYNIGEHTYNLSKEFKESHSNIQWNAISGLRHRLVHDYEGIKWNNISKIIFEELPIFTEQLKEICKNKGWEILLSEKELKSISKVIRLPETEVYYNGFDKGLEQGIEQGRAEMAQQIQRKDKEIIALRRELAMLKKQKSRGGGR